VPASLAPLLLVPPPLLVPLPPPVLPALPLLPPGPLSPLDVDDSASLPLNDPLEPSPGPGVALVPHAAATTSAIGMTTFRLRPARRTSRPAPCIAFT
jgi:hypothetical protein